MNSVSIILRVILIILAIWAFLFQSFYFYERSLQGNIHNVFKLSERSIPHFSSLVICVIFIIEQIKSILRMRAE